MHLSVLKGPEAQMLSHRPHSRHLSAWPMPCDMGPPGWFPGPVTAHALWVLALGSVKTPNGDPEDNRLALTSVPSADLQLLSGPQFPPL